MTEKKKSEKKFGEVLKDLFNGTLKTSTDPLAQSGLIYRFLVIFGIIVVLLFGVVVVIYCFIDNPDTSNPIDNGSSSPSGTPTPIMTPSSTSNPTPLPTLKPTPTPSDSAIIMPKIQVVGSTSSENMLYPVSVSSPLWIMNASRYLNQSQIPSYISVYHIDANQLILTDKLQVTNETADICRTYKTGKYILLSSPDKDAQLVIESPVSTSVSPLPQLGDLFEVSWGQTQTPKIMAWDTFSSVVLPKTAWKITELPITVDPVPAENTVSMTVLEIPEIIHLPVKDLSKLTDSQIFRTDSDSSSTDRSMAGSSLWRIKYTITGVSDALNPYANAEMVLTNQDGVVVDSFGWNGPYSSTLSKISKTYQPGDYTLSIYQRGCGVTLDFQIEDGLIDIGSVKKVTSGRV